MIFCSDILLSEAVFLEEYSNKIYFLLEEEYDPLEMMKNIFFESGTVFSVAEKFASTLV